MILQDIWTPLHQHVLSCGTNVTDPDFETTDTTAPCFMHTGHIKLCMTTGLLFLVSNCMICDYMKLCATFASKGIYLCLSMLQRLPDSGAPDPARPMNMK